MGHINADAGTGKASVPAHITKKWYPAAAQVTQWVNRVAGRSDLVAKLGPGLGHGAPACFSPHLAEVEVDTTVCLGGVDPAEVDLDDRKFRLGKSPFVGAISHEAAHAHWSPWVPAMLVKAFPDLEKTKRVVDVFVTLDESRIEAKLVRNQREMREYLRACAGHIVARDFHIADDPYGASIAAALLLARVDAGVFDEADVASIRADILTKLDQDTLDKLQPLWKEFQRLNMVSDPSDPDTLRALDIAREWLDVLGVEHDDPTENFAIIMEIDPSMKGEGDGDQDGEGNGFGEGIKEKAADGASEAEGKNIGAKKKMIRAEAVKDAKEEGKRVEKAKKAASSAFRSGDGKAVKDESAKGGGGHGWGPSTRRYHRESRRPTPDEHRAAVSIARRLEKVQYRDRVVTKRTSVAPPGRIRGRGAVLRAAQRDQGAIMTAEPWTAKTRAHTDEPPLVVGIMTDLSGSMGGAAEPSASLSWVMSEAARRIHGKVATVLFGAEVHGVVPAGAKQDKVHVFEACDGFEAFQDGFEALDGEIDLLNAPGARLLVIFSDAHFVSDSHAAYANKAMGWCRERGVAVVWVNVSGSFYHNHGWGEVVDAYGKTPPEIAGEIGNVAIEAVRKADLRRGAGA